MNDFFAPVDASCDKCGLPLAFKKLPSGRWCPTNPDGSDHWDLCRTTRIANMTPTERAQQAERDRVAGLPERSRTTATHIYCGDVPPWDVDLGAFRDFTETEKAAGLVCVPVDNR